MTQCVWFFGSDEWLMRAKRCLYRFSNLLTVNLLLHVKTKHCLARDNFHYKIRCDLQDFYFKDAKNGCPTLTAQVLKMCTKR